MMDWTKYVRKWHPTGSKYICQGMGVVPEDEDYVAVGWWYKRPDAALEKLGFLRLNGNEQNSYPIGAGQVRVYRRGMVDLIICRDTNIYDRFVAATEISKFLRTTDKSTRCHIHSIALYGHPMK